MTAKNRKIQIIEKENMTPGIKAYYRHYMDQVGSSMSERERKSKSRVGVDYSACRRAEKDFLAGRVDLTLVKPVFAAFVAHGFSRARMIRCTNKGVYDPRVAELRGHR